MPFSPRSPLVTQPTAICDFQFHFLITANILRPERLMNINYSLISDATACPHHPAAGYRLKQTFTTSAGRQTHDIVALYRRSVFIYFQLKTIVDITCIQVYSRAIVSGAKWKHNLARFIHGAECLRSDIKFKDNFCAIKMQSFRIVISSHAICMFCP